MFSVLDRWIDCLPGPENQVPPLRQVDSTQLCMVAVHPYINLEQWIEVAQQMGVYQKVHFGTPGNHNPPWLPELVPVARMSMPNSSSVWSSVRAVAFNQRASLYEVRAFARDHNISCAGAFEHIALDIQYAQVTHGISIISFDTEHCSVRLMSCGPLGNRELFVGPLMPDSLRSEDMHWLLR